MTVATLTTAITYTGNAATVDFPIPFEFIDDDQIVVTKILISTDVGTVLISTDYTLTGAGDTPPGNVNLTPAISALYELRIERVTPALQSMNIPNDSAFFPTVLETQLDRMVMRMQELEQMLADAVSGGIVASIANAVAATGSSVDGNFAKFSGTTGKIILDSAYDPTDFALAVHVHAFAALTGIPTTIAGYGITNLSALVGDLLVDGTHTGLTAVYDAAVPAINLSVTSTDIWVDIIKNATTTIASNTVVATDAQLQFAMEANASYIIQADIWLTVSSVSGYRLSITGPATPTAVKAFMTELDDGNNDYYSDVAAYGSLRTVTPSGNEITNDHIEMLIENGANAGTFGIQFAQNSSSATVLTVHKGSRLRYRKIV